MIPMLSPPVIGAIERLCREAISYSGNHTLVREAGIDPHVNALMFLGIVLFCSGYLDQALARSEGAIEEAIRLKHRPSLATSLAVGTRLLALMRDDVRFPQTVV